MKKYKLGSTIWNRTNKVKAPHGRICECVVGYEVYQILEPDLIKMGATEIKDCCLCGSGNKVCSSCESVIKKSLKPVDECEFCETYKVKIVPDEYEPDAPTIEPLEFENNFKDVLAVSAISARHILIVENQDKIIRNQQKLIKLALSKPE